MQRSLPISYRTAQIIMLVAAVLAGIPWGLRYWFGALLAASFTFVVLKFIESMWMGEHSYTVRAAASMLSFGFLMLLFLVDIFAPLAID